MSAESRFMVTLGPPLLNQYLLMHEGEAHQYHEVQNSASRFDGFRAQSVYMRETLLTS